MRAAQHDRPPAEEHLVAVEVPHGPRCYHCEAGLLRPYHDDGTEAPEAHLWMKGGQHAAPGHAVAETNNVGIPTFVEFNSEEFVHTTGGVIDGDDSADYRHHEVYKIIDTPTGDRREHGNGPNTMGHNSGGE